MRFIAPVTATFIIATMTLSAPALAKPGGSVKPSTSIKVQQTQSTQTHPSVPATGASNPPPPIPPKPPNLASAPASGISKFPNPSKESELPKNFTKPETDLKFKRFEVVGVSRYTPPEKLDIPGSDFKDITPMQNKVSLEEVNKKLKAFEEHPPTKENPIVIGVFYSKDKDRLVLAGDQHHTFVAAMKAGYPMELQLLKVPGGGEPPQGLESWKDCTYVNAF